MKAYMVRHMALPATLKKADEDKRISLVLRWRQLI
jgi:hypothetical protein